MKATMILLATIAIGYTVLSTTIIIWAELEAAQTKISILQDEMLDKNIEIKILRKQLIYQDKLISWNLKHNK